MKNHKWLVPLCAGVILALGAIAAALIPRLTMVRLVDYARSLPDDSWLVGRNGTIYRVDPDRFAPDALGVRKGGYTDSHVNTDIRPSGEKLSMEEFTLLSGGLLRQDGTSWRTVRIPSHPTVEWVSPYLLPAPVQDTIRAEGAKAELTDIDAHISIGIEGGRFLEGVTLTAAFTLPEGVKAEDLTFWRSVYLCGSWYRVEEALEVENPLAFPFYLLPYSYFMFNVMPPDGLYRLELWMGNEPLHFQPFRFTRNGNEISADEVD